MSKILRLGLLVADEPAPELLKENGDYVHMFTKLFEDAAGALNVQVKLTPFQVVRDQFPTQEQLGDFDAFVITGASKRAFLALVRCLSISPLFRVFGVRRLAVDSTTESAGKGIDHGPPSAVGLRDLLWASSHCRSHEWKSLEKSSWMGSWLDGN